MPKPYVIPKKCPPELKRLIEHFGSKEKAFREIHVDKGRMGRVVDGKEEMPADWPARVEKALGGGDEGPKFVPWDGTFATLQLKKRTGAPCRVYKNVPSMVIKLMEKFEGNVSAAARASGTTGNTIQSMIEGKTTFDDRRQRIVFEGLFGVPAGDAEAQGPDQYRKGIAICIVPSKNYDRVRDVAGLLKGKVFFKLSTPVGWLVIYELKPMDARKFKVIAGRDCQKIVCP